MSWGKGRARAQPVKRISPSRIAAGVSIRWPSVPGLPKGGLIGAPNDPSNESRPLRLLEGLGRIKLAPSAGLLPTALNIADTPRNLSVKELDAAIANTNRAFKSGLQIDRQSILTRHHAIDATIMQAGMIEGSMQMQVECVARLSGQDEAAMDFLHPASPSMEVSGYVPADS